MISFEMNLINSDPPSSLLLVFSSILHQGTGVEKQMSVNSHIISFKYTDAQNIHIYPHILIVKSELVVSVLIIYIERQVRMWNKTSHFKGDAEHGSENHPPEVADCGGSLCDHWRCKHQIHKVGSDKSCTE